MPLTFWLQLDGSRIPPGAAATLPHGVDCCFGGNFEDGGAEDPRRSINPRLARGNDLCRGARGGRARLFRAGQAWACSSPRSIRAPARSGRRPALPSPRCCCSAPRIWPAIFVGAFAANATTAGTLETSAVIALGNTLEGLVGGALVNHWSGGRAYLRHAGAGGQVRAGQRRPGNRHQRQHRRAHAGARRLCAVGEIRADLDHLVAGRRRRRAGGDAGDRAVGGERAPPVRLPRVVRIPSPCSAPPRRSALSPSARCCRARNTPARSASWRSCRCSGRRCAAARATPRPSD